MFPLYYGLNEVIFLWERWENFREGAAALTCKPVLYFSF